MRTHRTHFQGLNGDLEVIDRAGRRSEMHDVIKWPTNVDVLGNVMMIEFKIITLEQVLNVAQVARNKIVHGEHMETFGQKFIAEVRPEEACRPGYEYAFFAVAVVCHK